MEGVSEMQKQKEGKKVYVKLGDAAQHLPRNNVERVEIEHLPGEQRSEGAYEVFTYDQHNTCLNQQAFRYSHRSDKRSAMNKAISLADKEALPNKLKPKRLNF
jgi:hypothetical protein